MEYLKIVYVRGRQVLDSRGNPAVEAAVTVRNCIDGELTEGRAIVPAGSGIGGREAAEIRDGGDAFMETDVKTAARNIEKYLQEPLAGTEVTDQRRIDHILRETGGRENKEGNLSGSGANALLAVSLASADAAAKALHVPLYRYLGGVQGQKMPVPMMTVIDGGAHADNSLDVQEFMIVPVGADSMAQGIEWCCEIYRTLKKILFNRGLATSVGDEGGFAPNLSTEIEAVNFMMEAIHASGFEPGRDVCISLDVAAGTWQERGAAGNREGKEDGAPWKERGNGDYCMPKQKRCYSSRELIQEWEDLVERYPVFSLEDPLGAQDWEGWLELTQRLGDRTLLVGDDLFADAHLADAPGENARERLQRGIQEGCGNAILIQPGKIGTLSEIMELAQLAKEHGYRAIISHRRGESEDSFIADLAVALNTGLIKTGAPSRGERTAKYNQLLRIEEELYGQV
ncbi:MAG: phosphopyruvate hydratase [Lachnospiraceae bacterium]|nr:phosphopyruvate hydratase [Lachnospiraceae bacterium]